MSTVRTPTLWQVWIPKWHPPSVNIGRGKHWSVERHAKRSMRMLLAYYASEAGVTGAKGKRRVSIELTMAKGQRRPDAGNLRKLFDDCCKHAGLIIDDGPKWFSGPEPTFAAQRSEDWGTLITIENLT